MSALHQTSCACATQVPGLEDDLPTPPSAQSSSELLSEEPEDAEGGGDEKGGEVAEACEVPAKAVRQMFVALVPAAGTVSAGLSCAWTSRGTLQADKASVWALDLSRQVGRRDGRARCRA